MVMELPPAPSSVGREFVRQYYTLLNQAPAHLHRFYNNNSSFVHGGLDSPQRPEAKVVIGQKQIHQKIQQLNFRDCHAKISQVDSQATLGDGVVVQVTGELSNSGQPMRRFTQTFVLAAQTPKKFYVHNDIFRYQDLLCNEEDEEDGEGEGDPEEGEEAEVAGEIAIQQAALAPPHGFYNTSVNAPPQHHLVAAPVPVVAAPITIVNGSAHPDEMAHVVPVLVPVMPAPVSPQPPPPRPQEEEPEVEQEEVDITPPPQVEQPIAAEPEPEEEPEEEKQEVTHVEPEPESTADDSKWTVNVPVNEPKTYATLLKSGGPISFASAAGGGFASSTPAATKQPEYMPPSHRQDNRDGFTGRGGMGRPQRGATVRGMGREANSRDSNNSRPPLQQQQQQQRQSFNEDRDSSNNSVSGGDGGAADRRGRGGPGGGPGPLYTDSQQLFLGNLPHDATENDLREVFKKFGTVVDLRIHSKPPAKGAPGAGMVRVPNYGFVIFESSSSVQDVLSRRPIFYPEENGTKLNVEEKKTRPRGPMDRSNDSRPSDQNNAGYNNGRNNNGPPAPRGGGGMRGGLNRGRGGFRGAPMRGGGGGSGGGNNNNNNNFPARR